MDVNLITIAIDGFSSCGKSTLAKDLAARLNYGYVDSGAMYRAVTLYFIRRGISITDHDAIYRALRRIHIEFKYVNNQNTTFLNGENVESQIRQMRVSNLVSPVAAIPEVRDELVRLQRELGKNKGIVMDGRDIGTVVFPDARLKIFLTASLKVRVQRRFLELQTKGVKVTLTEVERNLTERDKIDSTRSKSPLTQAKDAVLIDNSNLTRLEQLEMVTALAKFRMRK